MEDPRNSVEAVFVGVLSFVAISIVAAALLFGLMTITMSNVGFNGVAHVILALYVGLPIGAACSGFITFRASEPAKALRNYGLVLMLLFACALLFERYAGLDFEFVAKLGAICAVFGLAGFWVRHAWSSRR